MSDPITPSAIMRRLQEPDTGILVDLEPESKRLIVAFGGLGGALGTPPFEFFTTLTRVGVKAAYLRDFAQAWYHRGVVGIGDRIDAVEKRLLELRSEADEMVMIGTSAGGYAALLFGALAGCGAHAFVPQTFIDPALREQLGDGRWSARVEALGDALDSRYADLLPLLSESTAPADIYYGTGNRLDRVHAERLDGLPQVTLHPFETERHNVARELRDSGWLERFLFGLARGAL